MFYKRSFLKLQTKDDIWIFSSTKNQTELTKTKSSHYFSKYSSIIKDNSTFTLYYSPKNLSKEKVYCLKI